MQNWLRSHLGLGELETARSFSLNASHLQQRFLPEAQESVVPLLEEFVHKIEWLLYSRHRE